MSVRALITVGVGVWAFAAYAQDDAKTLARKGLAEFEESCASDGYNPAGCDKAVDQLTRALQKDPSLTEVELALAQAKWNQAFTKPKADPKRAELKQESTRMLRGLVQKRGQAAQLTRIDAKAFYELGTRTPDTGERVQLLEKAVKTDPKHVEANRRLADVYLDQGRLDDAVKTYTAGIRARVEAADEPTAPKRESGRLDPEEAMTDIHFAKRLEAKGRPKEAVEVYDSVLQATEEEPRSRRCLLFQSVDTRPLQNYRSFTNKVSTLRPFCANVERINRAATLEKEGKVDDAIKELEEHQKENPRNEESYLMLERLYGIKGEKLKAVDTTRRFFRVEADKSERCKQFRRLTPQARDNLDAAQRSTLVQECGAQP